MAQPIKAFSVIRRHAWLIAILTVGFLSASVMIAYTMTPIYRAEGRLLLEQGEISSDIVETTVRGLAEERIELVRNRVMTGDNIESLISDHGLYEEVDIGRNGKIRLFRDRSSVVTEQLDDGTMSFIVAFDDEEPSLARSVVVDLMNMYQNENVKSRTESAVTTAEFLQTEAGRLAVEIADYEDRIASYKEQHSGSLPEQERLNMQLLDRVERDLDAVEREIRELSQRRAVADADLMQARSRMGGESTVEPRPGSPDRLRYLQAQYVNMLSTYSSEHPDVRQVRREIEMIDPDAQLLNVPAITKQIRQRSDELERLRQDFSDNHPDVVAAQRTLDRLQSELDSATSGAGTVVETDPEVARLLAVVEGLESELSAQRGRRAQLRERRADLERRLLNTPQVQREYLSLTRGYEQLKQKYDDIKLKQTQMELAVSVEQGQRAGRFSLSGTAQTPDSPVVPNRPALIFLGLLLGAGSGLLVSAAIEAKDKTLRDDLDFREVWDGPPLVTVPFIRNKADIRRRYMRISIYLVAITGMVAAAALTVVV